MENSQLVPSLCQIISRWGIYYSLQKYRFCSLGKPWFGAKVFLILATRVSIEHCYTIVKRKAREKLIEKFIKVPMQLKAIVYIAFFFTDFHDNIYFYDKLIFDVKQ